jgi:formate dehydrogenase major subunit
MKSSRRQFLATAGAGLASSVTLFGLTPASAATPPLKLKTAKAKETTTICPFCGVGCGQIVSVVDGKVVNTEGDPEHPINEGALCSKGAATSQLSNNERRLQKVLYRAPKSDRWEEKSWEWAIQSIADRVKTTRDSTFKVKDGDKIVNRAEGIACLGGAALDNEECYLLSKAMRSLGIVYLEHQARI